MQIGEAVQLFVTLTPDNATNTNVFWKSSNESVVKIDENGMLQAIGKGVAEIIVASEDDKCKARCIVTVEKNATESMGQSNKKEFDNMDDGKLSRENNMLSNQQGMASTKEIEGDALPNIQTAFNNFVYIKNNEDSPVIFDELSEVEKSVEKLELLVLENEEVDTNESSKEINEQELDNVDLVWIILLVGASIAVLLGIVVFKNKKEKH